MEDVDGAGVHTKKENGKPDKTNKAPHTQKIREILDACENRQLSRLRTLATTSGGLVSDEVRRIAWPLLLGYTADDENEKKESSDEAWRSLPRHRDEDQVALDVNRSFIYYPNNQSPKQISQRKEELSDLITAVLRLNPHLCYFQGYHDICQVFLLVFSSPTTPIPLIAALSSLRIRDFMLPSLSGATSQLLLIPPIIGAVSPSLRAHLSHVPEPNFALPSNMTMYAHDVQGYHDIVRIFDVLLARETVFSVYMFAQIILSRSEELFDIPANEWEMLHSILQKLPLPLNLEELIANTVKLIEKHPPESLRNWRSVSRNSVLKTARWPDVMVKQTVRDGEWYFRQQVRELQVAERRKEMMRLMWLYRRPAAAFGMAVMIGVVSVWMRRTPFSQSFVVALWDDYTRKRR